MQIDHIAATRAAILDAKDDPGIPSERLLEHLDTMELLYQLAHEKSRQLEEGEECSLLEQRTLEPRAEPIYETGPLRRVYDDDRDHLDTWENIKRTDFKKHPELKEVYKNILAGNVKLIKSLQSQGIWRSCVSDFSNDIDADDTLKFICQMLEDSTFFYRVKLSGRSGDRFVNDHVRKWMMKNFHLTNLLLNYEEREKLFLLTVEEKRAKCEIAAAARAQRFQAWSDRRSRARRRQ